MPLARVSAALLALALITLPAAAQAPAAGDKPAAAPSTAAKPARKQLPPEAIAARDAARKSCSAEADAKHLHKQERKTFRADCLKKAMAEYRAKAKEARKAAKAAKPAEAKPKQ